MFDSDLIDPSTYTAKLSALGVPPGTEVGIVVRVAAISRARGHYGSGTATVRARLIPQDADQEVETTDLSTVRNPLLDEVRRIQAAGLRVIARGRFVAEEPRGKSLAPTPMLFELSGFQPVVNNLTLCGATAEEVEEAAATLVRCQEAQARGETDALARHVLRQFHWIEGVMGAHLTERFRKLQRLTLLQALSGGDIGYGRHNMRLSCYISSSPGRGKRVLVELAQMLAPAAVLVQPGPLTEAGLCAKVELRAGGAVVVPGAIPRANKGTCIIEDLGRINRSQRHGITAALVAVTEDGRLRPLKLAESVFEAQVALHLNGNPQSKLTTQRPSQKKQDLITQRKNDLGIPLDLFSRLHVVANLDTDESLAQVAQDIAAGRYSEGPPPNALTGARHKRALKVLVAYLLDRFERVDLRPVAGLLDQVMAQVAAVVREATAQLPPGLRVEEALDEESICLRMANALRILVAAEARLQGRGEACAEDVAVGASMISMKVEVLRWLAGDTREIRPLLPLGAMAQRAETLRALRWDQILERFGGREVAADEVADALNLTSRLVRQELAAHGVEMRQGVYAVPTLHAYVEGEEVAAAFAAQAEERPMGLPLEEQWRVAEAALQRVEAAMGEAPAEAPRALMTLAEAEAELALEGEAEGEAALVVAAPVAVEAGAYERPLPRPLSLRTVYRDGIRPLPQFLQGYARCLILPALDYLKGVVLDGDKVGELLCDVALRERSGGALRLLFSVNGNVVEGLRGVADAWQPEVALRLCNVSWEARGLFALSLLMESRLPSQRETLELGLRLGRGRGMPPPLLRAVKAAIRRLREREQEAAA